MGRHHSPSLSTASPSDTNADADFDAVVESPFGRIDSLTRSDIREAAYELFFMSCRSSPGFGGSKISINYYPALEGGGGGNVGGGEPGSPKIGSGMTVPNSRIKKALGLRTRRSSPMRKGMLNGVSNSPGKAKRPMTSAEIMRLQMCVPEHSDHRLRKTLMRTLVGQVRPYITNPFPQTYSHRLGLPLFFRNRKFIQHSKSKLDFDVGKSMNRFAKKLFIANFCVSRRVEKQRR